jgi:hypothetical protein
MAKLTLNDIIAGHGSAELLNSNFSAIETALENTLSRDGTTPNTLTADIDMNSNDLLNVGDINMTGSISVGGTDYLAAMQAIYNNFAAITVNATISTSAPSGGSDGDVWYQV